MHTQPEHISQFNKAYFIGIGGIGMSALARYFNAKGWAVAGYDKTSTPLTDDLEQEGIKIHFNDLGSNIPEDFKDTEKTLVVYTPAIPSNMAELTYVQSIGLRVYKRSQILGMITRDSIALGVAGTHGKTTTSTLLAHILNESPLKCSAFLGGISTNYNSNFISSEKSEFTVVEADEFDRSFLQLHPFASIITSTDADHLDVYKSDSAFLEGFQAYADLTSSEGFVVQNIATKVKCKNAITYGIDCKANYVAKNLHVENGRFFFDVETPISLWGKVELGIPGIHNIENALACIAMCLKLGLGEDLIRSSLKSFKGVKRRFEYHIRTENLVYIDDYAHHPTELNALISSVRMIYPNEKIIGIFQPHLFSRTRDFFDEFATSLSQLDEVILLPIYPAREEPIEGVTSDALLDKICAAKKSVLSPERAIDCISKINHGIILTIGAGDIDRIIEPIKTVLQR